MRTLDYVALGFLFTAATAAAQTAIVPPEVSEDSAIVLRMKGAVTGTVRIVTRSSATVVSYEHAGGTETAVMSGHDCMNLWDYCLRRDALALTSTRAEKVPPDAAAFEVSFRIGGETHRFSVEGVDQLQDTRYRELVRELLSVGARHLGGLEEH